MHAATVRCRIDAPREVVFGAWLDAEGMRHWLSPSGFDPAEVTLDPRPGGRLFVAMRHGKGRWENHGEYVEIDAPRRLSFTWISASTEGRTTRVTVELEPDGAATDLVLTHADLGSPAMATNHALGWREILANLADRYAPAP
jgi:uncharacterized protein YndB with AHSA1/START domain